MSGNDLEFVFFHVGTDLSLPSFLIKSIRKTNPGSTVTQLSDTSSPQLTDTDRIYRYEFSHQAMMMARAEAYANLPASGAMRVFLDTDMLVVNEITPAMFSTAADIYLCRRYFDKEKLVNVNFRGMAMAEYSGVTLDIAWPYLGCFLATRSQHCLQIIYQSMKKMAPKYQNWYGDQIALKELSNRSDIKLASLSENHFGHLSDGLAETMQGVINKSIYILHFKGNRKSRLGEFYATIFGDVTR